MQAECKRCASAAESVNVPTAALENMPAYCRIVPLMQCTEV